MKTNKLILYKKKFFSKLKKFFYNLFNKKNYTIQQNNYKIDNQNPKENIAFKQNSSKPFLDSITLNVDKEKFRIINLKEKFDRGEIKLEDIHICDLILLIQAYNEETAQLKLNTQKKS